MTDTKKILNEIADGLFDEVITYKLRYGLLLGKPPIGYQVESEWATHENRKPVEQRNYARAVIDPVLGPLIKEAFMIYLKKDISLKELANIMQTKGWMVSIGTIHYVLTHPFYRGYMKYKNNQYRHMFPKLITEDIFFKVQEKLNKNKRKYAHKSRNKSIFAGMIRCGVCPSFIGMNSGRSGKYTYFRCVQAKGSHNAPYIRIEEIIIQLQKELLSFSESIIKYLDEIGRPTKNWEVLCKNVHKEEFQLRSLKIFYDSSLMKERILVFKYRGIFEILKSDPDIIVFKHQRNDEAFFKNLDNIIQSIVKEKTKVTVETLSYDTPQDHILGLLTFRPHTTDDLLSELKIPQNELNEILLNLQLEDKIKEIDGDLWRKI